MGAHPDLFLDLRISSIHQGIIIMKHSRIYLAAVCCAVLAACGGGGSGEIDGGSQPPPANLAGAFESAKYAGRWIACIKTSEMGYSKQDIFDLTPLDDRTLGYHQSRTYHNTADCTGPARESGGKTVFNGSGTFELLGTRKVVAGVESDKILWFSDVPSDFADAGITVKGTLGLKDDTLYVGDTATADVDGFPTEYYHVAHRAP